MKKKLLFSLVIAILSAANIAVAPFIHQEAILKQLPIYGAHLIDPFGYELDIPENWYVVILPATDEEIATLNNALIDHYVGMNCKTAIPTDEFKTGDEQRIAFVFFAPDQNCADIIPVGIVAIAQDDFLRKTPIPVLITMINAAGDFLGVISTDTQTLENGIRLGIVEIEPVEEEDKLECPSCIGQFHFFKTPEKALITIGIMGAIDYFEVIEPDIEKIIMSIKYIETE